MIYVHRYKLNHESTHGKWNGTPEIYPNIFFLPKIVANDFSFFFSSFSPLVRAYTTFLFRVLLLLLLFVLRCYPISFVIPVQSLVGSWSIPHIHLISTRKFTTSRHIHTEKQFLFIVTNEKSWELHPLSWFLFIHSWCLLPISTLSTQLPIFDMHFIGIQISLKKKKNNAKNTTAQSFVWLTISTYEIAKSKNVFCFFFLCLRWDATAENILHLYVVYAFVIVVVVVVLLSSQVICWFRLLFASFFDEISFFCVLVAVFSSPCCYFA